jgi:hypothetical protein
MEYAWLLWRDFMGNKEYQTERIIVSLAILFLSICRRWTPRFFILLWVIEASGTFEGGLWGIRLLIGGVGIEVAFHRECIVCFTFLSILLLFLGVYLAILIGFHPFAVRRGFCFLFCRLCWRPLFYLQLALNSSLWEWGCHRNQRRTPISRVESCSSLLFLFSHW